ncbi:MAG: sugar ABC transporter permease [Oscillospiraceae bacterium]|nr:sugar ABC transporter permease [Oscillospiraceae bacterium]
MDYISNTVIFTIATTLAKSALGILLALLLTHKLVLGKALHRMAIFTPLVMSYLVVGLVFKSLLHPATGFVNIALRSVRLDFLANNWLSDASLALGTVISVDTWKGVGYIMVVTIAGLKSISATYYEAAEIDGANYWQRFLHITLPLIWPVLLTITILNLTYGLRVFDIIYALTNGGPGHATDVINTAVFSAFSKGDYAMGTTLSTVLFVFVMAISYFLVKMMENKGEEL